MTPQVLKGLQCHARIPAPQLAGTNPSNLSHIIIALYSLRAVRPCPIACLCVSNTYYLWLVCMAFGWVVPCASWQASTILLLLLWHAL